MAKCGCGHSPENCTCKPSCKCGCAMRKSTAFLHHQALLEQAWRTMKDTIMLKGYYAQCSKCGATFDSYSAHRDHEAYGCGDRPQRY